MGVGYFGYISWKSLSPLEGAEIEVNLPPVIAIGEEFEFSIEILNTSTEAITLTNVSVGEEFVKGIQLGDSYPTFELRQDYEFFNIPMEMFVFNEMVLAGESLTIEFESKAKQVGDFTGQMFICLDDQTNCEIILLRTVVEEAGDN